MNVSIWFYHNQFITNIWNGHCLTYMCNVYREYSLYFMGCNLAFAGNDRRMAIDFFIFYLVFIVHEWMYKKRRSINKENNSSKLQTKILWDTSDTNNYLYQWRLSQLYFLSFWYRIFCALFLLLSFHFYSLFTKLNSIKLRRIVVRLLTHVQAKNKC